MTIMKVSPFVNVQSNTILACWVYVFLKESSTTSTCSWLEDTTLNSVLSNLYIKCSQLLIKPKQLVASKRNKTVAAHAQRLWSAVLAFLHMFTLSTLCSSCRLIILVHYQTQKTIFVFAFLTSSLYFRQLENVTWWLSFSFLQLRRFLGWAQSISITFLIVCSSRQFQTATNFSNCLKHSVSFMNFRNRRLFCLLLSFFSLHRSFIS